MTRSPHFSSEGHTLVITMDDGRANAIHGDWVAAFDQALDRAEEDDIHAVVLRGRHKFFSAGLDLRSLPALPDDERLQVLSKYARLVLRFARLPKPTIAVVDGHAMAGGAIMLLCCDRRYSTPGPWKIGLTEMSIGLQLPTLVVGLARVHLTPDRLQDALVEGRAYAPADAARVGFLHAVVEADAIDGVVQDAVAQLSKLDVTSYGITKRRVRDLYLGHDTESFAREVSAKLASLSMPS